MLVRFLLRVDPHWRTLPLCKPLITYAEFVPHRTSGPK